MKLPDEKEINFYGTPWPSKSRNDIKSLGSFTFDYLGNFKLSSPSEKLRVYGEASPDYLISTRSVLDRTSLLTLIGLHELCLIGW
jgi:hypothetical protein